MGRDLGGHVINGVTRVQSRRRVMGLVTLARGTYDGACLRYARHLENLHGDINIVWHCIITLDSWRDGSVFVYLPGCFELLHISISIRLLLVN